MAEVALEYAPPQVTPLPFIAFDKHHARSLLPSVRVLRENRCQGVARHLRVTALRGLRGAACGVISETFSNAFKSTKVKTQIAYSVKTNYLPAVCSVFREEGAWAEVVSEMEYQLSRALGVPPMRSSTTAHTRPASSSSARCRKAPSSTSTTSTSSSSGRANCG